jgi:hypothetical protein
MFKHSAAPQKVTHKHSKTINSQQRKSENLSINGILTGSVLPSQLNNKIIERNMRSVEIGQKEQPQIKD